MYRLPSQSLRSTFKIRGPLRMANLRLDVRRKNLGSAIQGLFNSGDALAADGLETLALWSMNIPGEYTASPPV